MINCSIGICAYNEGKNIGRLLAVLKAQKLGQVKIEEIIVVASGCTDQTEKIVKESQKNDGRIKLISQAKREGKSAAVNLFLAAGQSEVLVLISGDTLPEEETLEKLVSPFADPQVGMTGGRPQPVNSDDNFIGFCVNYMWELHHLIALRSPKCGEMIAFRRVFNDIPASSAVDEACVEERIRDRSLAIKYIPEAVIKNKGPETIRDFLKQRRRIYSGHIALIKNHGYKVSTLSGLMVLKLILRNLPAGVKKKIWVLGLIGLEVWSRLLGVWDFKIRKKEPHIWAIAETTKKL